MDGMSATGRTRFEDPRLNPIANGFSRQGGDEPLMEDMLDEVANRITDALQTSIDSFGNSIASRIDRLDRRLGVLEAKVGSATAGGHAPAQKESTALGSHEHNSPRPINHVRICDEVPEGVPADGVSKRESLS